MIVQAHEQTVALANELRPVLLRIARGLRRETEQLGVTSRQVTLLVLVERRPGVTAGELALEEGVSAPAMTRHVDRLEREGLLRRVRSQHDRRRIGLALTPAAARLLRRVRERRTTWLAERLATLSAAEAETLEAALPVLERLAEMPR